MQKITVLRGLPGSGKSTYAKNLVLEENYVRFNRDDYRAAQFNRTGVLSREQEDFITAEIQRGVRLALHKGFSVVLDNTTLKNAYIKEWDLLAQEMDVEFEVVNFDGLSVSELEERVAIRFFNGGLHVPTEVIQNMYDRFTRKGKFPPYVRKASFDFEPEPKWEMYRPDAFTRKAIIVDLDGTFALFSDTGHRGPYDTDERILLDVLAEEVAEVVDKFDRDGYQIIFMSGRKEEARQHTMRWLADKTTVSDYKLFMRANDDRRRDDLVKYDLFNEHVRHNYNVRLVLDDRNQVVRMWRAIGMTTLQVADGDF